MCEMKNTLHSIYCRLDATDQKTNELENREVETFQTEAKEKKNTGKVDRGSVSREQLIKLYNLNMHSLLYAVYIF